MISIPGSFSFAKLVMMSSAVTRSAGDASYAFQDPVNHSYNGEKNKLCFVVVSAL